MSGMGARRELSGPRFEIDDSDEAYPELLREVAGHPGRLYGIGDAAALSRACVSIVGARKSTPYGIACAQLAARCATGMGIGVVSGAAIGCDQASQREALRLGASVVAVLGSGADVVYPPSAYDMLGSIVGSGGAVVSLQPWGAPPVKWAFVRRNAVIATLSRALVICEAGMPSGTFSTAQSASDAGREVLVFPGSVFSPNSTGSNYLIASDTNNMPIWDQKCLELAFSRIYGRLARPEPAVGVPGEDIQAPPLVRKIFHALEASPSTPGALAEAFEVRLPDVMRALGRLEAEGSAGRLADGRYSLTESVLDGCAMGRLRGGAPRS